MFEPSTTLTPARTPRTPAPRVQAPPTMLDRVLSRVQMFLLALVAAGLLATATPASAESWQAGDADAVAMMVDDGSAGKGVGTGWESSDLPIIRWKDATGDINTFLNGQGLKSTSAAITQEYVVGTLMDIGNTAFPLATFLTQMATEARILDAAGPVVDEAFAAVGDAVFGSGLVAFILVLAFAVGLWQIARSAGRGGVSTFRSLLKPLVLMGVLAVFVMGASSTTDSSPGTGSPWWAAQTTSQVVTTLATTPAAALTTFNLDAGYAFASDPDADDPLSCQTYMSEMADSYRKSGGSRAAEISRALPQSISGMWEMTGLATYVQAQYGQNQYGSHVFCRGLDYNANLGASQKFEHSPDQITTQNVNAWPWANGRDMSDGGWNANIMHWSACRFEDGKFVFADGWAEVEALKKEDPASVCSPWYDKDHGDYELMKAPVVFVEDQEATVAALDGTDEELRDFILTTQGWSTGASFLTALIYAGCAIIISCIFAIVALLVLLASIGMIVMMFGILAALVFDSLPSRTESKLGGYVSKFLGLTFVTAFSTLLFAVLIMFTSILLRVGRSLVEDVPILMMMWAGIAPILAVFMLHWVFSKWFKMPSPVTPSGARAWMSGMGPHNIMAAASALNAARNQSGRGDLSSDPSGMVPGDRGSGRSQPGQGENASDQMTPAGSQSRPEEIDASYAGLQKAGRNQAMQEAKDRALSSGMTPLAASKAADMAGSAFDKSADAMGSAAEVKAANAADGAQALTGTGASGRAHTLFVAPVKSAVGGAKDWKAGLDASVAAADGSKLKTAGAVAGGLARGTGKLIKSTVPAVAATSVGALVGSIVAPGVGTLAGAAIGGGLVRARGYAADRKAINGENLDRQAQNISAYRAAKVAAAQKEADTTQMPPAPPAAPPQPLDSRQGSQAPAGGGQPAQGMPAAPRSDSAPPRQEPALSQAAPPRGTAPAAGQQQPGAARDQAKNSETVKASTPTATDASEAPTVVKKVAPLAGSQSPASGDQQAPPAAPSSPPSRPQAPPPPAPERDGAPPAPGD